MADRPGTPARRARPIHLALLATIGRKVLIIWDRLQAHRSILVREYVEQQRGKIALEYLPAHAPELNPRRVHLGLSQVARNTQLLCPRSDTSEATRKLSPALYAASLHARDRILETGRAFLIRHSFNEVSIGETCNASMGISGMKGLYFKPYKANSFWFMRDLPVVWANTQAAGPWRHSRPSSASAVARCRSGVSGRWGLALDPTRGGSPVR